MLFDLSSDGYARLKHFYIMTRYQGSLATPFFSSVGGTDFSGIDGDKIKIWLLRISAEIIGDKHVLIGSLYLFDSYAQRET